MWIYTSVAHSCTHVHHSVADFWGHVRTFRHHHVYCVCHHSAHISATGVSWPHHQCWSECGPNHITNSFKDIHWNTHVHHHWSGYITEGFKGSLHSSAAFHRRAEGFHTGTHCIGKTLWIIHYRTHHLWGKFWHICWEHCHFYVSIFQNI